MCVIKSRNIQLNNKFLINLNIKYTHEAIHLREHYITNVPCVLTSYLFDYLLIYLIIHLSTSKSLICEQFNEAARTVKKCTIVCMEVTSCKQNNQLKSHHPTFPSCENAQRFLKMKHNIQFCVALKMVYLFRKRFLLLDFIHR
jgi:hypothetical protein